MNVSTIWEESFSSHFKSAIELIKKPCPIEVFLSFAKNLALNNDPDEAWFAAEAVSNNDVEYHLDAITSVMEIESRNLDIDSIKEGIKERFTNRDLIYLSEEDLYHHFFTSTLISAALLFYRLGVQDQAEKLIEAAWSYDGNSNTLSIANSRRNIMYIQKQLKVAKAMIDIGMAKEVVIEKLLETQKTIAAGLSHDWQIMAGKSVLSSGMFTLGELKHSRDIQMDVVGQIINFGEETQATTTNTEEMAFLALQIALAGDIINARMYCNSVISFIRNLLENDQYFGQERIVVTWLPSAYLAMTLALYNEDEASTSPDTVDKMMAKSQGDESYDPKLEREKEISMYAEHAIYGRGSFSPLIPIENDFEYEALLYAAYAAASVKNLKAFRAALGMISSCSYYNYSDHLLRFLRMGKPEVTEVIKEFIIQMLLKISKENVYGKVSPWLWISYMVPVFRELNVLQSAWQQIKPLKNQWMAQ